MDKELQEIYDNLLLSVVFDLDQFPKKSGYEGTAYFIDDNFVVKESLGSQERGAFHTYENFENYCKELCAYHKQGFCVPKIYSWTMLPKNLFKERNGVSFDRYYILEERVKGKTLLTDHVCDSFDCSAKFCSKKDFESAVLSKQGELYKKIVECYLKNCIKINEQLEVLPKDKIEKFVLSDYQMMKNSKFGAVDMHNSNVMFDGENLTIIDNSFADNMYLQFNDEKIRAIAMKDMLRLISNNSNGLMVSSMMAYKFREFQQIHDKYSKVCKEVVSKFVDVTNDTLSPKFSQDFEYFNSRDFIKLILDGSDEKEVLEKLQKDF